MNHCRKKENYIKYVVVCMCLFLTGCGTIGLARESTFESAYENVPEEESVDIYTSSAHGIVEGVNTNAGTVTFYLLDRGEEKTFSYDTATVVQDRHGSYLTMEQLTLGEVVDIAYNADLEKMGSVALSMDGYSYDSISNYILNPRNGTVQIGGETYGMSENVKVFSGQQQVSLEQILEGDIISFRGLGSEVVSIIVDKGHGYLKLENEDALIGGWVEVGQSVIQQISDNMLIVVPEGSYTVRLTADNIEEYREVNIDRDRETILNLQDIEVIEPINGVLQFDVYPEEAEILVDDAPVDPTYSVRVPLGLHKITAKAEGYHSYSEFVNVTRDKMKVQLSLDEAVGTSDDASVSEGATITIQAPEDVEVYQDNLYMGITPLTYEKTAGDHTITLRKQGYDTRSYQISVEDDDKDLVYSFPDLYLEGTTPTVSGNNALATNGPETNADAANTVSGNAVSDNEDITTLSDNEENVSGNSATVSGNN